MNRTIRTILLGLTALILCAAPASAQIAPFEAEVDCGGEHLPGDVVLVTFRLENHTLEEVQLDLDIHYSAPGWTKDRQRSVTLGPDQDKMKVHQVILPDTAPEGRYRVQLTATSETAVTFDRCNFKVRVRN